MKTCSKCKIEKSIEEFSKDKSKKDGFASHCKVCVSNKDKIRYRDKYVRDKVLERQSKFRASNPNYIKNYRKTYKKKKEAIDPLYKTKNRVRSLIYGAFKRALDGSYNKGKLTEEILGCSFNYFIKHIESQFLNWMNWENYGEWEFDHIIPISSAKTEEEIYLLNHWSNFQPMDSLTNRVIKKDTMFSLTNLELKITFT